MLGGVILAGGRSRRMGTDKALLDWHGVPLVVHVCEALKHAVDGPVVVVKAPGQALPVDAVDDPVPHQGPVMGVKVGLRAVGTERAFVCGVDQPFAHSVIPALLRAPEADVVAYDGEPLGAIYRTGLELPDGGSLMAALQGRTHWLGAAPEALRSLNRPSDLQ